MARTETPFTVAAAVLATVEAAFETCGVTVGKSMVAVGGIVVDDCCDGLLIVAPERVFRARTPFPTEVAGDDNWSRDGLIGVELNVLTARCIPVLDDRGNAPKIEDQESAYAEVLTDAAIVWGAVVSETILGVDSAGDPIWERANISQIFPAAQGGCAMVETRFWIGIAMGRWCPPCPGPSS